MKEPRSLEVQREEFASRRLTATPIAGLIAWTTIGVSSIFLGPLAISMVLFAATGAIVYLGVFISRFTYENFLDKNRPKNAFDALFLYTAGMSVLVYAIAIPFFLEDYTSLPLSIDILTGLMWLPISWVIQHWIGLVHGVARTAAVVLVWYLFSRASISGGICRDCRAQYIFSIAVLENRWWHLTRRGLSNSNERASSLD